MTLDFSVVVNDFKVKNEVNEDNFDFNKSIDLCTFYLYVLSQLRKELKKETLILLIDLIKASGCSCCRDNENWFKTQDKLAKLFDVPRYDDDSGVDWDKGVERVCGKEEKT